MIPVRRPDTRLHLCDLAQEAGSNAEVRLARNIAEDLRGADDGLAGAGGMNERLR